MTPRSYIRHRDIRIVTEDTGTRDVDKSEHNYTRGRYFEAGCGISDQVGDLVNITGDDIAGVFQVGQMDVFDGATFPVVGIIAEKLTGTSCFVVTQGIFITTGLTPGKRYWVGIDGALTDTFPAVPGNRNHTQVVGKALSDTELLIDVSSTVYKLNR